jgi:hypothetical protein
MHYGTEMSMANWLDPLLLVINFPGTDHNKNTFIRDFNNEMNANYLYCEIEYNRRRDQSINKNSNTKQSMPIYTYMSSKQLWNVRVC